ncbi:MAG: peptidoglycan DD-metalloendopeptidase family protein [Oscillospiraceae bacterium]|nr:peptidoglycan DD-metalloendopeptidase family protein [Oscillospiraceae bacterium]
MEPSTRPVLRTLFSLALFALFCFALPQTASAFSVQALKADEEAENGYQVIASVSDDEEAAEGEEDVDELVLAIPFQYLSEENAEVNPFAAISGQRYFLALNGQLLFSAETPEELLELIYSAAAPYIDETTVSCALPETFQLELCYGFTNLLSGFGTDLIQKQLLDSFQLITVCRTDELVTIPYTQYTVEEPTLYQGEEDYVVEGVNGLSQVLTETTCLNGQVCSSQILDSTVIIPMEPEVFHHGTLIRPEYIWPAEGAISSRFGQRRIRIGSSNHKGLDIAAYQGSDILAAKAGTVIFSGRQGGYGKSVEIDHGDGTVTVYAHNSRLCVEEGDYVEQGEVIAKAGNTGISTGTHLHFEIQIDGEAVDPELYLPLR